MDEGIFEEVRSSTSITGTTQVSTSSIGRWSNSTATVLYYDDEPVPGLEAFRQIFDILLTICSILGVVLNICVIKYSRRLRNSTGDLTHCFIGSMAIADLLLCCFAQPFDFILQKLTTAGLLSLPDWLCRIQHMIYWLGYSASGLSLTLLNLDKLLFFKWPLHYGMVGTKKMAACSTSACWLICLMGSIAMVVPSVFKLSPYGDCGTIGIQAELYIAYTIAYCILPVLSSAVVSVYLALLVHEMRRNSSACYDSALFNDYTIQQRLKAMAFIFITTAWTFVALTPFRVFNVVRIYEYENWITDRNTSITVHWLAFIFIYLLGLNPSVNAGLTLFTYAPYKNLFKTRLYKVKCKILKLLGRPIDQRDIDRQRYSITQSDWV